MRILAKAKHTWRKFYDYMRYDFKEMAFPSALPDPPGTKKESRKLTWNDYALVLKVATRLYIKSFKTPDIDVDEEIELVKNPGKARPKKEKKDEPVEPPSAIEDLAVAAKAGSEHLKPALQRIYMTKASAYKDALKNFVEGYQEGLTEVLNSDNMSKSTSNNTASDIKPDLPGVKEKQMKPDTKVTEVPPDMRTQHSHTSGSEANTEINANDEKKGKNIF